MNRSFFPHPLSLAHVALALGLATGAAQAQSQVAIYGMASVEMLRVTGYNSGTLAAPSISSDNRIDNSKVTNSRLGVRGSEELGNGLSALFNFESAIGIDTGTQANASKFWNRGSFVGLKHADFGTVTLGRQWDLEDGVMSRYFIGGGYTVFQFSEFGYISDLVDNAVKYTSPTLGGLTVLALAAPGEGAAGRVFEVAGNYVAGPFEVGGTYRTAENLVGAKDRQSAMGISYDFGTMRLHAGFAKSDAKALGLKKASAYDIGLVWNATPAFQITTDYVSRDQQGTGNDSDFFRLQGSYALSKRSTVFVNLVGLRNQGTAAQKFYGNGAAGQDQNVFSLGVRHVF